MLAQRKIIGYLILDSQQIGVYNQAEADLVHIFVDQAAIAIQNVKLYQAERQARRQAEILREETRHNLNQITRLYELSTEFVSTISLAETAKRVVEKIIQATNSHSAVITLLDEAGNVELTTHPDEPYPRPDGTTMAIFKSGQPIAISDVQHEPALINTFLLAHGLRAFIGLPLKAGDQIIGVLFVRHTQPRQFSWREIETLLIFANQAGFALQNARLYEQVQHHAAELEVRVAERTFELQVLFELAQALEQATHYRDVVRLILLHLYQAIPYDVAASLLLNDHQNGLVVIQSQRPLSAKLESHLQEIMRGALERIRDEPLDRMSLDIRRIQAQPQDDSALQINHLDSLMQSLIYANETPIGILLVATENPKQFGPEHAKLLRTMAAQAAESIQRLQSLLAAEHQRLESLVAYLPDGVVLLDAELHLALANQMARQFLTQLGPGTGKDPLTHLGDYPLEVILTATSSSLPFEIATANQPRHIFEVTAKSVAVGPEAGGWILVIREVTEERAIQKRIRQQEQLAAMGQLAAGIAHDFNNILTSIIGFSELLLADPAIPALAKEDLVRITKQGKRAALLVSQILDFSRQSITEKRPLDFASFLKETIKLLERTILETIKITLDIAEEDRSYMINADLVQLQQGLTNLAVNARDAMPSGGTLRFHLRLLTVTPETPPPTPEISEGDWVALSVSDSGLGIPHDILPHIFEPFFTTKEVGQGTGLGLAQVYGIVKQHGGDIDVKSEPGQGTDFTLFFPALPLPYQLSRPAEAGDIPHGNQELILLVEDNLDVLDAAQAILERLNYRVLTATDGEAALQLYDQYASKIDLVLTDLTMPKMGGVALSLALRDRRSDLRTVMMTGYPLKDEAKVLLSQGFIEWIHKPLNTNQLAHLLHRFLNE